MAVAKADYQGTGPFPTPDGKLRRNTDFPLDPWLTQQVKDQSLDHGPLPIITGRDLTKLGWAPSPLFSQVLAVAEQLAEHDLARQEIMALLENAKDPAEGLARLQEQLEKVTGLT